ncbi:hypothetical protein FXO37_12792 [Capsicum annuum]|nr:hypothetical protein FXO37_12792 [Capsicum annuum]
MVVKTRREFNDEDRKKVENNYKAKKLLLCGIGPEEYNWIYPCENAKKIWACLKTAHEGTTDCNRTLSLKQETRLMQMGEIVRNASFYLQKLKINEEKEGLARKVMEKMTMEQLSDLMSFYNMMGQICSKILERKLQDLMNLDEEF